MDISRWPIHKVMALPDWCFGQKWWIGMTIGTSADTVTYFYISDKPPDNFVVWDILVSPGGVVAATRVDVALCLCNEAPVVGNIRTLTGLLRQFGTKGEVYDMHLSPNSVSYLGPMKVAVEAVNQGIGGAFKLPNETAVCESTVAVLISAIPREVPNWVVSGMAGVR